MRERWSLCTHPPTLRQQRSVSAGVRQTERRGEGVVKESRAGRGGNKRECAFVVSFAATLPPALEKTVLQLLAQKTLTLVGNEYTCRYDYHYSLFTFK